MADRLGLVATIKDRANEIYYKLEEQKLTRGRNRDVILAACLFIACRQENLPHTIKEISYVADGAATMKKIRQAKEYITKHLKIHDEMGSSIHADGVLMMKRFCSNLGMNYQAVKAAQEAVQNSQVFDIRKNPNSISAAIIFMIAQHKKPQPTLEHISITTGVAVTTIRSVYKDLYLHIANIIPRWYAKDEDIKNHSSP